MSDGLDLAGESRMYGSRGAWLIMSPNRRDGKPPDMGVDRHKIEYPIVR
jgi:hypothetical protein